MRYINDKIRNDFGVLLVRTNVRCIDQQISSDINSHTRIELKLFTSSPIMQVLHGTKSIRRRKF